MLTQALFYTVSAEGYTSKDGEQVLGSWEEKGEIQLDAEAPEQNNSTVSATVSGSGTGTVMLSGNDIVDNPREFGTGSTVDLVITADTASYSYIKSVTINGKAQTIGENETQSKTINITLNEETYEIDVEFVVLYEVVLNANEGGTLAVNDNTSSFMVEKDTVLSISATSDGELQDSGKYILYSATINGTAQTISESGFSTTYTASEDNIVDGKITIKVDFIIVYTVEVTYSAGGEVTSDPEFTTISDNFGSVYVEKNTKVKITATPEEGFRVSGVVINNEAVEDDNGNDGYEFNDNSYQTELSENTDYTIQVTFSENRYYSVTVPEDDKFTYTVEGVSDSSKIPYGSQVSVKISPDTYTDYYKVNLNGDLVDTTWRNIEENKEYSYSTNSLDENLVFEITKGYDVIISTDFENATVTVNGDEVSATDGEYSKIFEEGSSVFVKVEAHSGYYIASEGSTNVGTTYENTYPITGALEIEVNVSPEGVADIAGYPFNEADALRRNGNTYVFAKGTQVIFTPSGEYDKLALGTELSGWLEWWKDDVIYLDFATTYTVSTDTTIYGIKLYNPNENKPYKVEGITKDDPLRIVYDETKPTAEIECTTELAEGCTVYGNDVTFSITATDPGDYSGIKNVSYQVFVDGNQVIDEATVTTGWIDKYNHTSYINHTTTCDVTLDPKTYKGKEVVLKVQVTDRAGNSDTFSSESIMIDPTEPEVYIDFLKSDGTVITADDYLLDADGNYYFDEKIVALVQFVESEYVFNSANADNCIVINETKTQNNYIEKTGWSYDSTLGAYVKKITFNPNACYEWDYTKFDEYMNNAGIYNNNVNCTGITLNKTFTVDTKEPNGTIDYVDDGDPWIEIFDTLTFGIFENTELTFTATGTDVTSPIASVEYYIWDESVSAIPTDKTELISKLDALVFSSEQPVVSADEKFVVFAKITDYAGNYKYISTNGIVVDIMQAGECTITITPDEPINGKFYNGDVGIEVSITDDFSGIESASYEVLMNDKETEKDDLVLDYTDDSNKLSAKSEFVVEADKNNADNIVVKVYATDRAGNEFSDYISLNINTTKPTAAIEFVDTYKDDSEEGYFTSRTARIIVTDRASCFNAKNATEGIEIFVANNANSELSNNSVVATDGSVSGTYYNISKWTSNGDVHTAEIEFLGNAKYKWSFNYTNDADLKLNSDSINLSSAADSVQKLDKDKLCSYEFTVDNDNPTASLKIQETAWDELIETLTFGIFSKEELAVYAKASDATSPIIVSYYKYDGTDKLDAETLDTAANAGAFKEYTKDVTSIDDYAEMLKISDSERFTIYLKVADYAGNYIYISSDGHIIDMVNPDVQIDIDAPKGNGVYNIANGNIKVSPTVTDPEISSGISKITYTVEKLDASGNVIECTQSDTLYEYTVPSDVQYDDLVKSVNNKSFNVDSTLNNWSRVKITVKAVDNAGNEGSDTVEIDIDATAPSIDVTYDNNNSTNSYFNADRTATVVITERNDHFSSTDATKGIVIEAVDVSGQKVDGTYTLSNWTTSVNSVDPDATTHTATIKYSGDANYTFAISYTDKAGNANSTVDTGASVSPYDFTVDKTAPKASVSASSAEGRTEKWEGLVTSLNFGFWSKEKIAITSESSDATSPIASVSYYKASSKNSADFSKVMTVSELNNLSTWTSFNAFNIVPNEQAVVYIRVADMAGNITYVCTNGLIVDNTSPIEEVQAPQITVTPQGAASGIYNGDVSVSISVEDPLAGGTYSGLKTVSYRVLNMGEVTQSGTLYTFNNANPADSQLLSSWNGQITVDSSLNNSNDVVIEVYGEDNALNSSTNSISIKIDTTAPTISVSYNNNSAVDDYFNEDRVATVVVTERNFNEDEVIVTITNTDGVIPSIGAWTMSAGSGNGDDTRWSAPITYSSDGDYTFDISCTDMAGNAGSEPTFASGTVAPTEFTIDLTDPVITVSYDSQSDNGYYDDTRTATITINEHNFNADDVNITIVATDDSVAIDAPSASQWSTRGDVHTATIVYSSDAKYTFSIAYTDDAGNEAQGIENEVFYVDKTAPELSISGVENQSANSGEVAPIIEFADTNIDFDSVEITLSGANRGDNLELIGDYSDIHNGQIFNFENFAETEENDDIYTLSVSLSDYAGNTSEATITFSVNRFGSTYALSEGTKNLIGSYVTDPEDIVITEVNANELSEITVTLFKNNSTLELVEGEDYSVSFEGGDGQWYKYTYTIFAENFTDDGVYRINVHSKDKAGNVAENTLDTKATEISFGVDKTPPNVVVANTESGETYAKESHTVLMNIDDNLKLASVTVYLDGEEYAVWTGAELEAIVAENGEFSFEVSGDSTKAHNVEIVSLDSAGNETVVEIEDFYVTTNLLVRYYNNKPLFFGSIFGVIALIAFIIFLIVYKRRKREQVRF